MMRTHLLVLLVILAAAFVLSGCGSGSSTTLTPATPQISIDSVTASASQTEPGQGPITLTASLKGDPTGAGVTFGASCAASQCGTVSTTSPTSATYTPPTGTLASTLSVTITAMSNKDISKLRSVTITVMPKTVVPTTASTPMTASINNSINLPLVTPGTGAQPFSLTVGAAGSSLSGLGAGFGMQPSAEAGNCAVVPDWLASLFDAQHGSISGIVPSSATDFNCGVAVKDALGVTTPAIPLQITVPILFQAGSLPGAEQGQSGYAATLVGLAQGGSGAYSFSGSLPDGLSLAGDGSISGNISDVASDLSFTAKVTDSKGANNSRSFTISVTTVASVDSVTSSAPQIEQGQPPLMLSAALKGKFAELGVTWSASCSLSQCGTVTSTSPTTATYNPPSGSLTDRVPVTLTATSNKNSKKSNSATITVVPAVAIAQPTPASLNANIGSNFSLTLQTSAGTGIGPFTWTLASGSALPTWLNLSSSGVLSATQVPNTAITSQFTVRVTDSVGITASLPLTLTIPNIALTITTASLPNGEQTQASYTALLTAQGGSGTYSWKLASGLLPAGLTLASNGSISGSPAANATTQTFTVQATDTANSASTGTSQPLTLTIIPALAIVPPAPGGLVASIGNAYNLMLQTSPGTGSGTVTWGETSGNLSKLGLSLAPSTGVISALQVPSSATTQQITLQATDSLNVVASLPVTITVPTKIITASLPSAEQTQASYSAVLTAQGGSGSYSWTVASGSLPAGLNLAANGSISGSPAASATTQTFTAQVADSGNPSNASTSQPLTITISPQVAIVAPTAASLIANIGGNFSLTLQTGAGTGVAPFTWTLANGSVLPPWLTFNNGVLSATQVPITANTSHFAVQVTDSANVVSSLPLTVTIPVKILSPSLPNAEQTQASYNASLTAQGGSGTYTWTLASGALPTGLNLASNGSISGSPAANATTQTFTVQVSDSADPANTSTSQPLTITINPQVAIVPPSPASLAASIGTPFSLTLQTAEGTGVGPFTWALANGSTLPQWLSLSAGGVLSATQVPITGNTVQFAVQVTDSASVTASLPLTVIVPVKIVTTSLPNAEQTQGSYSATLTAQGGSGTYSWTVASGSLPAGLNLASNGSISGSPAANATTQTFTVQAIDSVNPANTSTSQPLTLAINPQLAIVQPAPDSLVANIGNPYNLALQTSAGTGSGTVIWSETSQNLSKLGLTISPTGAISGALVPTTATTQQITVQAKDSLNVLATLTVTITVPIKVVATPLPVGEVTVPYNSTTPPLAQGGSGSYSWGATGLPTWATINPNTGVISGANPTQGSSNITITATDTTNAANIGASQPLSLTINPQLAIVQPAPNALVASIGNPYNLPLQISAGTGSGTVTWSETSQSLSKLGLTISSTTGAISGALVPTTATTQQVTVQAKDSFNVMATLSVTITVPVRVVTTPLLVGEVTVPYNSSTPPVAQGGSGSYTWGATGLPTWATINPNTGVITGSNPTAGSSNVTITATDSANPTNIGSSQPLTLTINPQLAIVQPASDTLVATIGNPYNLALQISPGTGSGTVTWSETSQNLSKLGLTISSATGAISGILIPTTATTQLVTVQAKDSFNVVATLSVTITIPIKIVTANLPSAEQTQASYTATLAAQGGSGTYSWTLASGSLPAGLTLATNGSISGSPQAGATTQTFTVQASDTANPANTSTSQALTLSINPKVAIAQPLPASLALTLGSSFNLTLQTIPGTGVAPFTWSLANGSTLPPWLSLSPAGALTSAQVPANANSAQFTVQVTDSANVTASLTLSVTVPFKIITTSLPSAEQSQTAYSATLAAQGGSGVYSWTVVAGSGSLPAGLNLAANGSISGSPAAGATTQTFTVQVTDSLNATATQQFTITINPQVAIAAPSLQDLLANIGSTFTLPLQTSAGTGVGPFTWAVANGSTLPSWLSLSAGGLLSATQVPTTANTAQFTVQVTDAANVTASLQLTVTVAIKIVTASLPIGEQTQSAYNASFAAQGGSGGYTWTVTSGTLPAGLNLATNGSISGSPSATATTQTFTVQVTDSAHASTSQQFTITINPQLAIDAPPPANLAATVGSNFSLTLQTTQGTGVAPFTWALANGSTLPPWLNLSSGGILSAIQVPTTANTAQFTVQVTDSANVVASLPLSVTVAGVFKVTGTVSLINGGGAPAGLGGVVVSIANSDSSTTLSVNTLADGSFTIPNVPNGTYTATLAFPSAPSSAFLPASTNITNTNGTLTIKVNNGDLAGVNFNAALGFTVSGKLSYGGKNQNLNIAFISLQPLNCNNCPSLGTTAPTPHPPATPGGPFPTSPFVINGVPPGTYTLRAWMDYAGFGIQNAFDPAGTGVAPVTVSLATGNITSAAVTMNDATTTPNLISGPLPKGFPIDSGVIIQYQPIVVNGVEQALVYNLQWSSTDNASCETAPDGGLIIDPTTGSGNPIVAGSGRTVILDSNNSLGPAAGYFINGVQYFVCMQGFRVNPGVGTLTPSTWSVVNPPVTIGAPAGSSGTNTVSGNVIIPDTAQLTGPLYAGCYDTKGGKIYSDVIESPVTSSLGNNHYSVAGIPTGASCFMFAMIDQDFNGLITPSNPNPNLPSGPISSDIYNINAQNPATISIAGNTVQDIDLTPFVNNSASTLATEHVQATDASSHTQETYNLKLLVTPLMGLPTQVTLLSGPNVIAPADFAICGSCGAQSEFNISLNTNGVRPQVGDSYTLQITYSDVAIPPDFVSLTVTGVSDAFATSLMPFGSAPGTTPTFSWADPLNPSNFGYRFLLSDSNGNAIWQIPGANSFSGIFSSSITSVPWSTTKDPTGASNPPSVTTLTGGATYTWSIAVQDTNNNSTRTQVSFIP